VNAGWRVIVVSALEAPAVVAGLDDIAAEGQPIEQRGVLGMDAYALLILRCAAHWDVEPALSAETTRKVYRSEHSAPTRRSPLSQTFVDTGFKNRRTL
jgi:hypothetical protein